MTNAVNVCVCYQVSEDEIARLIGEGASTPEQIGDVCMAGRGCGDCHELLEELIEDYGTGGSA